jgi:WD40 repeat protein
MSSRWRVIEVDAATGTRQDTGVGGSFPAPPLALVADFAHDAGSFVLWAEGGGDTALRVDLDDGQTPLQVSSRRSRSPALRVLPSGAAQLWTDGVVTVLDRGGTPIQELDAHGSAVYDIAVSPDATWAVSAGEGGAVVLWRVDPSTGRWSERERLPGHVGGVVGAEVDGSGWTLVTVAEDETVISWDMSPVAAPSVSSTNTSVLLDRACAIVARDFTPAEWARYLPDRSYAPTCTDLG